MNGSSMAWNHYDAIERNVKQLLDYAIDSPLKGKVPKYYNDSLVVVNG